MLFKTGREERGMEVRVVTGADMGMKELARGLRAFLGVLGSRAGGGGWGLKAGTGGGKSGGCEGITAQVGV